MSCKYDTSLRQTSSLIILLPGSIGQFEIYCCVAVGVAVGVSVGVDVKVEVDVTVDVAVGVAVDVAVMVAVCVPVGVTGVNVAVAGWEL